MPTMDPAARLNAAELALAEATAERNAAYDEWVAAVNNAEPFDGSVILDNYQRAWQRHGDTWYIVAGGQAMTWAQMLSQHGPVTLVVQTTPPPPVVEPAFVEDAVITTESAVTAAPVIDESAPPVE